MAATTEYLVIFDLQGAGGATEGYKFENAGGTATAKNCLSVSSAKAAGPPGLRTARVVAVLAENEQVAATGVRQAFGESMNNSKVLVVEGTNAVEKSA